MKRIRKIALGLVGIISALLLSGCFNSHEVQALYGPPIEQDLYGVPGIEEIEE